MASVSSSCGFCGAEKEHLSKCSRCKSVFYCSKECQKSHWKAYKANCKLPPEIPAANDKLPKFPQPARRDLDSIARFVCSSLKTKYFSVINDVFEDENALKILNCFLENLHWILPKTIECLQSNLTKMQGMFCELTGGREMCAN